MFDIDIWQEILSTMQKNKLRTALTGFSVFWGIFMLLILLGSGSGVQNAAMGNFNRGAINSMWIFPGRTSLSYQGMKPERAIALHDDDYTDTKRKNDEIVDITSRYYIDVNTILKYGNKTAQYEIQSARESDINVEQMEVIQGRFINIKDLEETRKVTVISPIVRDYFFGDKNPIGEYITANGIPFKIIGVFKDASEQNHYRIYIPTTTAQSLYNGRNSINILGLTVDKSMTAKQSEDFATKVHEQFAQRHKFDPKDDRAVFISNNWEQYKQTLNVFLGIKIFIWVIGIMSIIAAIVGVANIMLISVKERTKEIGVRKALGATPGSIIRIVLFESILITSFFGYIGMFLGTLIVEVVSRVIPPSNMFSHPNVDVPTALGATILLVISGALAGYVPARQAANVRPIEALRDE